MIDNLVIAVLFITALVCIVLANNVVTGIPIGVMWALLGLGMINSFTVLAFVIKGLGDSVVKAVQTGMREADSRPEVKEN